MEQVSLQVKTRSTLGTTAAQVLRRQGWIPGVIYGKGQASRAVMVEQRALQKALHTKAGENVLINLDITDGEATTADAPQAKKGKGTTVIIKEVQHHPVDGGLRHVDFHQISLTETIRVNVAVVAAGESVGVKQDGGVLEYLLRDIEVECLPTQIPEHFTLDVSPLKIGDSLHVKDLILPEGVKVHHEPEAVVLSVLAVKEEKVIEAMPGAEETAEPEVLKQKKPEELEAEASAKTAEKSEKGKKKEEPVGEKKA